MSREKCFCGADTKHCTGTLRLKKAGGQKLICCRCYSYGGTLKAGQKIGNRCEALICADSGKPLLFCPKRRPLTAVKPDNRCYCGGKTWVCHGRLKLTTIGRQVLQCDRCDTCHDPGGNKRVGDHCLRVICAASQEAVTGCCKRPWLKKPPQRERRRNRQQCFLETR